MNAYLFTASATYSQVRLTRIGATRSANTLHVWSACTSLILCAESADEERPWFEEWICAQPEGENPLQTQINKIVAAQFFEQLLTETDWVPLDWRLAVRQMRADVAATAVDDLEQGYWLDANTVCQTSRSLEDLRHELPEDVRSGLNWNADKQFFFMLSVLSPPGPAEPVDEPAAGAPDDDQPAEDAAGESGLGSDEAEADFPVLAEKEAAVLIRARNLAVAAWLWRKYAAETELAGKQIQIEPLCGVGRLDQADPDEAIAEYTKDIELHPDDAEAYSYRADAKDQAGDLDGAISDCTRVIDLKPDDATAYYNRATAKLDRGDLAGAAADYTKAIEIKPDYSSAYHNRGEVRFEQGNLGGAMVDCNKVIELKPDDASAYRDRGHLRHRQGDLDGAMADYTKATELNPAYAWAYHARGLSFYDTQAFTNAMDDFQKVINLGSSLQDYAHFRIWLVGARLGEAEAATAELQAYLQGRTTGKPEDWEYKIGRFLAGQVAEWELLAIAKDGDPKTAAERLCQAYFYAGLKQLFAENEPLAEDYFRKSIATERKDCMEYSSAVAELKWLEG